jgi:uncharacterized protein with FMN-binding domain
VTIHRLNAIISASALVATPVSAALTAVPATAATTKRVSGPTVNMRWGGVRVVLYVTGRRVTDVHAAYPTHRARSQTINQHAIPILRTEVLRAQSSRVSAVSGATDTSGAYKRSLATALRTAGI